MNNENNFEKDNEKNNKENMKEELMAEESTANKEESISEEELDNEESIESDKEESVLVDFKYYKAKDRRREERRVLEPARLVRIVVNYSQDFIIDKWISVVDVSRHGMKIISDIPFKLENNVKIEFYVAQEPVVVEGRIAWCKELIRNSGLYAIGLDLANLKDADYETINKFLINFAPFEERRAVRVKKPFLIEVKYSDETQKFYTYAVDLSVTGMRLINDFELPVEEPILIKAILGSDETNYIKAKVVWQQEKSFGFVAGLQFIEADNEDIKKIENFIYS